MKQVLFGNKTVLKKISGFSWLEFIVVLLLIAILSAIAIPKIFNFTDDAKQVATQAILSSTRTDIATFTTAQKAATGTATFPTLIQFQTLGTVLQEPLLPNPYNGSNTIRDAKDEWNATNPPVNTSSGEGWNYDESVGKFWANTNSNGENTL